MSDCSSSSSESPPCKRQRRGSGRARNWVFTVNNPTQEDKTRLDLLIAHDHCRYLVYGKEVGEKKTPHWQGYVEFCVPKRLGSLKQLLPSAHWEVRRGSRQQAADYCKKDGDFHEYGDFGKGGQGRRTDIQEAIEVAKKEPDFLKAVEDCPQLFRYHASYFRLRAAVDLAEAPKWRDVQVLVYYGATGVGKTRAAMARADCYKLDMANSLWFDGYSRQKTLVIDDFYGWIKYGHLLQLLDGYKMRLEIKGGFVYAFWTTVIITSNKHPDAWYSSEIDTSALRRRIGDIVAFDEVVADIREHPEEALSIANTHIYPDLPFPDVKNIVYEQYPQYKAFLDSAVAIRDSSIALEKELRFRREVEEKERLQRTDTVSISPPSTDS